MSTAPKSENRPKTLPARGVGSVESGADCLHLPITCPRCGAQLELLATGAPVSSREVRAVVGCPVCPSHSEQWILCVALVTASDERGPVECGTAGGARRHRDKGEALCPACASAPGRVVARAPQGPTSGPQLEDWERARRDRLAELRRMGLLA